mmetsp:Transcript_101203/g.286932  ORF Transcript_101203/g.286932 Transcript_101203/m.286932 type:complete len:224 (-) Transcript_101203:225-896(-)
MRRWRRRRRRRQCPSHGYAGRRFPARCCAGNRRRRRACRPGTRRPCRRPWRRPPPGCLSLSRRRRRRRRSRRKRRSRRRRGRPRRTSGACAPGPPLSGEPAARCTGPSSPQAAARRPARRCRPWRGRTAPGPAVVRSCPPATATGAPGSTPPVSCCTSLLWPCSSRYREISGSRRGPRCRPTSPSPRSASVPRSPSARIGRRKGARPGSGAARSTPSRPGHHR